MVKPLSKLRSGLQLIVDHHGDLPYLIWALKHRKRLHEFENKHLGEKCFIIGNGPSLNQMDLLPVGECKSFGLNKIYLHPQFEELNIEYHVAVNPLVLEQGIEEFKKLNCVSFLSFAPCYELNIVDNRFYYLITGHPHRFSFDPYDRISEGCTVTYVALQLAYFMGFKTVYLIGLDHSFRAEGNPHEKQLLQGTDQNHFHPDYFSGKEWNLPDLKGSELSFELARYYFEKDGRNIFDATVDGKLNVFPKVDYQEALGECRSVN